MNLTLLIFRSSQLEKQAFCKSWWTKACRSGPWHNEVPRMKEASWYLHSLAKRNYWNSNSNTKLKLSLKPTVRLIFFREAELLWEWFEVHGANLQGHCWKITGLKRHLQSTVWKSCLASKVCSEYSDSNHTNKNNKIRLHFYLRLQTTHLIEHYAQRPNICLKCKRQMLRFVEGKCLVSGLFRASPNFNPVPSSRKGCSCKSLERDMMESPR